VYFPYLYGRQGELRALSDLKGKLGTPQSIFPLIEPVTEAHRELAQTLNKLGEAGELSYVIVNPSKKYQVKEKDRGLDTPAAVANWMKGMSGTLHDRSRTIPTLEIREGVDITTLTRFTTDYPLGPLGVSVRSNHLPHAQVLSTLGGRVVQFFLHREGNVSACTTSFGYGNCVEVADAFRSEYRNADYGGSEHFTDAHLDYKRTGFPGFSDYTLLPGVFAFGGGPIGAAVIHMSYISHPTGEIHVEHFVSDEVRRGYSTAPTKLLQAMTKLEASKAASSGKFAPSPGLQQYADQFRKRKPTSPAHNKKQQISHHIFTVGTVV
jgi:hypothetical protein